MSQSIEASEGPEKAAAPLEIMIGDIVASKDFERGVIKSLPEGGAIISAIGTNEDGREYMSPFGGTQNVEDIHEVVDHWDVNRMIAGYKVFMEGNDLEAPPEMYDEFRQRLQERIDAQQAPPPALP